MAYSESILRRARERLSEEQQAHERETQQRIAGIYTRLPQLREIDRQLRITMTKVMTATFRRGGDTSEAIAEIRTQNLALQREREWLLESEGIEESDLEEAPFCLECGGSGYIGARMCACLKELCRQEQKKELSSLLGGKESFESFKLSYYSDEIDPKLGAAPRELMQVVFSKCRRYAAEFSTKSPSLLMSGGTGLGKTFLSAAIARTVADGGHAVVYETAVKIFADFEEEKFEHATNLSKKYRNCDLLILDDLGTEMTTLFTQSALYTLVNGRMLDNLPTVISTNLTTDEIRRRYSPQIASRLLGSYTLLRFAGSDLRMR